MTEAKNPQFGADGIELPDFSTVQVTDQADVDFAKLTSQQPPTHLDGVEAEITLARSTHAITAPMTARDIADSQPEMAKLSEIGHAMLGRLGILKAELRRIQESGTTGDTLRQQLKAFLAKNQKDSGAIARQVHDLKAEMVGRLREARERITGEVAAKVSLTLDLIREAPPAAVYDLMMDLARSGDPAWPFLRPVFERYAVNTPKHWIGMRDAINNLLSVPFEDPAAAAREAEKMADDWARMIEGRLLSQASEITELANQRGN